MPTPTVVGDGIDNDCDGKIDEELCTTENRGKGLCREVIWYIFELRIKN